jgi:hypothetical protein
MNFSTQLQDRIKPEINHIYYEAHRPDTIFCREHAFHIYILSLMLGHSASIVNGNFAVHITERKTHHSDTRSDGVVTPDGHYWNRIDGHEPVDASISFRGWLPLKTDIGLVWDSDLKGNFDVAVTADVSVYAQTKTTFSDNRSIVYLQHRKMEPDPEELLKDPYSLLIKPSQPLTQDHGPQIFDKITLHLYMVALGRRAPLHLGRPSFAKSMKTIKSRCKNARRTILETIEKNRNANQRVHSIAGSARSE